MRQLRHPALWRSAWIGWFGVLWLCSSLPGNPAKPLPFPHIDKIEHFGYFLAGGFVFAGWRMLRRPPAPAPRRVVVITLLAMALAGFVDEWHQCFTPGRSGADPWDLLADVLGGATGAWLFTAVHRRWS